jgi:hypothetical protein
MYGGKVRKVALAFTLLFLLPAFALAQSTENRRGWGYGFFGIGGATAGNSTIYQAGGGGEVLLYKGLGVGAEGGAIGTSGSGAGTFSVNGAYHFLNSKSSQKLVPFVTSGYTFLAPSDETNLFNFGGGVNYWAGEHVGLRVEVRDHVFPNGNEHLFNVRVGITFR